MVTAQIMGLDLIAVTDHYEYLNDVDEYRSEIVFHRRDFNIQVLTGLEVNVALQYDIKDLERFDVVIGSFHGYPTEGVDYFKREYIVNMNIIENSVFQVVGHAGGQSLKFMNDFPIKYFEDLIKKCVKYNKVFELNYSRHYKVREVLRPLLEKYNPYVSFGSDAHVIGDVGKSVY